MGELFKQKRMHTLHTWDIEQPPYTQPGAPQQPICFKYTIHLDKPTRNAHVLAPHLDLVDTAFVIQCLQSVRLRLIKIVAPGGVLCSVEQRIGVHGSAEHEDSAIPGDEFFIRSTGTAGCATGHMPVT